MPVVAHPRGSRSQDSPKASAPFVFGVRPSSLHEICSQHDHSCTGSVCARADDLVMELEHQQSLAGSDEPVPCRKPTLEDRLTARMLARWLDAELARGVGASFSEANAARAQQLTSERTRRALALRLYRLVDRAQNPGRASLIAGRSPCRDQVDDAMPLILTIRSRLLSGEPLAVQGIARLKTLLGNYYGPCYVQGPGDALTAALREISALLDLEQLAHAA